MHMKFDAQSTNYESKWLKNQLPRLTC